MRNLWVYRAGPAICKSLRSRHLGLQYSISPFLGFFLFYSLILIIFSQYFLFFLFSYLFLIVSSSLFLSVFLRFSLTYISSVSFPPFRFSLLFSYIISSLFLLFFPCLSSNSPPFFSILLAAFHFSDFLWFPQILLRVGREDRKYRESRMLLNGFLCTSSVPERERTPGWLTARECQHPKGRKSSFF